MRNLFLCLIFTVCCFSAAQACVGKTLFIGVTAAPQEQMLAELMSVMVSERTGTSVEIKTFKDAGALYAAVKRGEVGLLVENSERALKLLNRPAQSTPKASYDLARKEYRQSLQLVWLEPFGCGQYETPVISLETINKLPALPRLLKKLGGAVNDQTCARLLKSAKGEKDQKKAARTFLKANKLI